MAALLCACGGAPATESRATPRAEANDPFDARVLAVMQEHGLPGGQVVIARGDEVLLERSYGVAREGEPVNASTRFRIASLSKAITATAVHLLVLDGRLSLDEAALPHLGVPREPADARWTQITVRQLLEHSAGFDRHESFDWMFVSNRVSKALDRPGPPELDAILEVVLGEPLDFAPGESYSYSNFGYALLGRVIEHASGMSYERFVQTRIFEPAGVTRMALGRTRPEQRPADEAHYFPHEAEATSPSVFPGGGEVPTPDGGFYIEPMAAHGGWIASAVDVARFLARIDGRPAPDDVIPRASLEQMLAAPSHDAWEGHPLHYGHGLFVSGEGDARTWFHDGSKPGTTAVMARDVDGTIRVALFNGRPVSGDVSAAIEQALASFTPPR